MSIMDFSKAIDLKEKYKDLFNQIFKDIPEHKRRFIYNNYELCVNEDKITRAFINTESARGRGYAIVYEPDEYDEETGARVALNAFKNKVLRHSKFKLKYYYAWMPKKNEFYYTIRTEILDHSLGEPRKEAYIARSMWRCDDVDYMRYSERIVFKTKNEARKYMRAHIINGRRLKNKINKLI